MMANRKMLAFFAAAVLLVLDSCAAAKTVGERSASASASGEAIHLTPRLTEKPIRLPFKDDETGAAPPTPFEHSSGYFKLNRTNDAHMFYFFFRSRGAPTDPVVLWMTGGPGCSSELAVFYENGPYSINDDLTLSPTKYGWDTVSNLIYVDQPINTGFSYSDDPLDDVHSEKRVAEDMFEFLAEFTTAHPELAGNDFYVTGESYAGHYVPAVAHRAFKAQQAGKGLAMKLKGFAIGNGLTDPAVQYGAYADYALAMDVVPRAAAEKAQSFYPECRARISKCKNAHATKAACLDAVEFCEVIPAGLLEAAGNINVYDVRKSCTGDLCYDFSNAQKFLNKPEVLCELGVPANLTWQMCSAKVHQEMMADWMKDLEPIIPAMLEADIRVMVYAGEDDFICNWLGNHRWVRAMPWSGQAAFNASRPQPFVVEDHTGGDVTEHGPLSFVKMSESGHMVPMDQGKNAVTMLQRFITGQPIKGGPWPPAVKEGAAAADTDSGARLRTAPRRVAPGKIAVN